MSTCYVVQSLLTKAQLAEAGWKEAKADGGAEALSDGNNFAHDVEYNGAGELLCFTRYGGNNVQTLVLHTNALSEHDDGYWKQLRAFGWND